jgi:ATP-dependent DNA helicase DinG
MKKNKLAFIDVETTGLNPDIHEIIQIGCVIAEQNWDKDKVTLKHIDEFELKINPENISSADPQALRVNGYTPAEWIFAYSINEAMKIFQEKTKDCIFVAHNVSFDSMYIEKAFIKTGLENMMHYHKLDTLSIAYARLGTRGDIEKYSLGFLCDMFGIKNQNAHTALADARATYELFPKLINE